MTNSWSQRHRKNSIMSANKLVSNIQAFLLSERAMITHNSRTHHMYGNGKKRNVLSLVLRGENNIGLCAPHID